MASNITFAIVSILRLRTDFWFCPLLLWIYCDRKPSFLASSNRIRLRSSTPNMVTPLFEIVWMGMKHLWNSFTRWYSAASRGFVSRWSGTPMVLPGLIGSCDPLLLTGIRWNYLDRHGELMDGENCLNDQYTCNDKIEPTIFLHFFSCMLEKFFDRCRWINISIPALTKSDWIYQDSPIRSN